MQHAFNTVGLIGKPHHPGANHTLVSLYNFLQQQGLTVYVEERVAESLALPGVEVLDLVETACDGLIASLTKR